MLKITFLTSTSVADPEPFDPGSGIGFFRIPDFNILYFIFFNVSMENLLKKHFIYPVRYILWE